MVSFSRNLDGVPFADICTGNLTAPELVEAHRNEYDNLTKEEKDELVQELIRERESQQYGLRLGRLLESRFELKVRAAHL